MGETSFVGFFLLNLLCHKWGGVSNGRARESASRKEVAFSFGFPYNNGYKRWRRRFPWH
jgi:hypothetical protein